MAVKTNIEKLKNWGMRFIEPAQGKAVCGDEGRGKLADIDMIFEEAKRILKART